MEAIVLSATATTIKEDASKFDRIKDVDEDPRISTLFNMIIESFI